MSGSSCIVRVRLDGEIRRDGCRYWSADMIALAGQLVSITRRDPDGMWIEVLDRTGNKVCADLLEASGFLDTEAARDAARFVAEQRQKIREGVEAERAILSEQQERRENKIASVVRWQAEALIQLIDQRIDDARLFERVVRAGLVRTCFQNFAKFIDRHWPALFQKDQHRELEISKRQDIAIQLAEVIFKQPHALLDGWFQGTSSSCSDVEQPNPACEAAHRLSGDGA